MSKSERLVENVKNILTTYGKHIKSDKHLLLLYWQQIDGVEMDKESISTTDFINKATSAEDVISTRVFIESTN